VTAPLERREVDHHCPHPNWQVIIMAFAAAMIACIILI